MTSTLLADIGLLATQDPRVGELTEAAIAIEDTRVVWIGATSHAPATDRRVELGGAAVVPGFVDSHAHLVFDGDRAGEFSARMAGMPYGAGGIASTVTATRAASDDVLRANLRRLSAELLRSGVTTFECKSGYGLDVGTERRSLALAAEFTSETTFLGAHVVPAGIGRAEYLALVVGDMLTACAPHARWVDVFCDTGAFDGDEAEAVLRAGLAAGLGARVHANQLAPGPGAQLAVQVGAASADHCTHLSMADVDALADSSTADSSTVATLLPLAEFSTRSPYPDARRLLDAGVIVALATDCNPGSAYSTSMPLAIALAVREMGMTPAEALRAATAHGATALRRNDVGAIVPGLRADLVVLDAPSYVHLAYRPGVPLISQVWRAGERVV
ncbi:MAG: imidazolonepropionase [Actinomycetota bacterium]|nr:imidazolonepropionase [Actinomycetota bacterium]